MTPEELEILKNLVAEYRKLCEWFCLHPEKFPERYAALFKAEELLQKEGAVK